MIRLLVPIGGFAVLAVLSFTLIVAVVIRPWSGPDESWRTHLNLTEEPISGYTRTAQSIVSPEGTAPISVWRAAAECDGNAVTEQDVTPCGDLENVEWVVHGCASCHGLQGTGGVGPNLLLMTLDDLLEQTRFGPVGMPVFDPLELSDEHIAFISAYLEEMKLANPDAIPTPTPTPTPRPVTTATATVGPDATPEAGLPDSDALVLGRLVFEETAGDVGCAYCHGLDGRGQGEGGEDAPNIRGASRSEVRQALKGAFDMSDIKLSSEELAAVIEYLQYLIKQS